MSDAPRQAVIYGLSGPELTAEETRLFKDSAPWGYILFSRNISDPEQLMGLTEALRDVSGNPHVPILIDQEGGRVARLKPPLALRHPPAALYGQLYEHDPEAAKRAAHLGAQMIGQELRYFGVTVDCLPCLDLGLPETSEVIGDRAYGDSPDKVAALGRAAAEGLMEAGVLPVIKHLPGHGRGQVDSHLELPVVETSAQLLSQTDFACFTSCADLPLGMTGHLLFSEFDEDNVSTQSPRIISEVIRSHIGFDGLLMSDDISMQALSGSLEQRALKSLAAGCDLVLHCNGDFSEMTALAECLPDLDKPAQRRAERVDRLLAAQPRAIDISKTREDWGEIVAKHFPEASDAL
ncbi:MAG: beta-N-acetylhexosaminidase [Parvibaculales bacterium]